MYVYTFTSFIPSNIKAHDFTNLRRSHIICSTYMYIFISLNEKVDRLAKTFLRNGYTLEFFQRLTRRFTNQTFYTRTMITDKTPRNIHKRTCYISLSFTGKHSIQIRNRLHNFITDNTFPLVIPFMLWE